jgi:hypothetical protein
VRADLAVAGGALVVAGAAVSLAPGVGGSVSVPVPAVVAIGVAVAAAGLVAAAPESPPGAGDSGPGASGRDGAGETRLGSEFEARLDRVAAMSSTELRYSEEPAALRESVREATVAVLARQEGIDRETAADRVASGEWTDDPIAAAFLSASVQAPVAVRVRERLSATPRAVSRTRRTLSVLEGWL